MYSRKYLLIIALMGLGACTSLKTPVFTPEDKAIRGYDPVAYFISAEPREGKSEYTFNDGQATWYFENADNRKNFIENPNKYTPEYGGYCAYAMSKGFVVSTDPQAWTIENDRLFLNYSLGVRKTWLKDTDGHIPRADEHWKEKSR